MCFFPRILESLPPLPRQHSAVIGCTKNYQPIGVTVHSHCVESFGGLLQRYWRGRGFRELWKNTIFPAHPVYRDILEIEIYQITKLLFSVKDNPYFKWYISLNTFELNIQKHSLVSEVVCLQCSCADQRFEDQLAFPK